MNWLPRAVLQLTIIGGGAIPERCTSKLNSPSPIFKGRRLVLGARVCCPVFPRRHLMPRDK